MSLSSSPFAKRGQFIAHEEMQYLDLVREILTSGVIKSDRTGTGTRSVFGRTMRFSLRDQIIPLLTTKRMFWRGIRDELLWFIRGDTSAKRLADDYNVHIWDQQGSRANLDKLGLKDNKEGDLGPIYGFQWRHFGAKYEGCDASYEGKGVDQLKELIHTIKTNPDSHRMVISAWNPVDIPQMTLPPCHVLAQFYVANGELSCQLYQRSADMGLGVPFNISSYALLTHMLAYHCGLKASELIHVIGDAHVYLNHELALREQLLREPKSFPRIRFVCEASKEFDTLCGDDVVLEGYEYHPAIEMEMSV
jgi:thymidylate synthase